MGAIDLGRPDPERRSGAALGQRYFAFFCFFDARFSLRVFLGCFFSVFPPLSLLATLPPGLCVCISMRDRPHLVKSVRITTRLGRSIQNEQLLLMLCRSSKL